MKRLSAYSPVLYNIVSLFYVALFVKPHNINPCERKSHAWVADAVAALHI